MKCNFDIGKHPVSALMEICVKRRIGQPEFVLVEETGPSHLRRFQYKVNYNIRNLEDF